MFCKAERLVLAPNSICPSLGSATAKLVGSKSKQKPHFVTKKANNRYCCDTNYPMWKSAKICSHIIAYAYPDKCLCDFLAKITKTPNFCALSKCGTPFSAGKKPINVRKNLWQQHCQVCKKCSCALPILVFWLLRQLNQPFVLPAHKGSLLVPNSVSMPSLCHSGPVSTSGTSVASKFSKPAPETSQSVSASLAYVLVMTCSQITSMHAGSLSYY